MRSPVVIHEKFCGLSSECCAAYARSLNCRFLYITYLTNLKIIFDRSAFHGANFDLLQQSQLLRLSKTYAISIYHTPVFLEETISLYLLEKNRGELERQLTFIFEICNGRWFRRRSDLWIKELVEEQDLKARSLMPNSERHEIEQNILHYLLDKNLDAKDLEKVQVEKHVQKLKSIDNRRIFVEIRDRFASEYSIDKKQGLNEKEFTEWFVKEHLLILGESLIHRYLETDVNKDKIFLKWKKNPNRYPYFTNYCKGTAYSLVFPVIYPNKKIDTNALIDVDHLCHLHSMDLIVSNDNGFMNNAFDYIYQNSGKSYYSTIKFVEF